MATTKKTTHHMTKSLCPTIALISNIEELLSVNAVDGILCSVLQKSHINVFSSRLRILFGFFSVASFILMYHLA